MSFSTWANIELPDELDADDVPGWFSSVVGDVDPLLLLPAADVTERDTRYADAPKGAVVVTKSEQSAWIKTSDTANTWKSMEYDTGWVTNGFLAQTGWTLAGANQARRIGEDVEIKMQLTRTGADIVATASGDTAGNIPDTPCIWLPPGFIPSNFRSFPYRTSYTMGNIVVNSNGSCSITSAFPGSRISTNQGVYANFRYFRG